MLIGAMNHPGRDPAQELEWIARAGFDFVDLTLEPPGAQSDGLDGLKLGRRAAELGLGVVGHTFWGLPIGSGFERLRRAAVKQLRADMEVLARAGARGVTIHPHGRVPHHDARDVIRHNAESLRALSGHAEELGLELWVENVPGLFNHPRHLRALLAQLPQARLTLDAGHANLAGDGSMFGPLLKAFGDRLAHVHLSDNRGGSQDLHLPLGSGTIDWPETVAALRAAGYGGTITLEVFSPDVDYRILSREKLRGWWEESA